MGIQVTASELQQSFGSLSDKARHEPIIITKHDKPSLVLMSVEEYDRLKNPRQRRAMLTADLPEEWIQAVKNAKVEETE